MREKECLTIPPNRTLTIFDVFEAKWKTYSIESSYLGSSSYLIITAVFHYIAVFPDDLVLL